MKTSICAIIKDEHLFLEEWIEWHFGLGFDAIHLFEDKGSKSHEEICEKYSNVYLRRYEDDEFVRQLLKAQGSSYRQLVLYQWFADNYKKDYNWIAFIDIDEFVILEDGYTLNSFFSLYEDYPAIHLSWKMKGASGNIKRPKNVMDYYTNDVGFLDTDKKWRVKSVINTKNYQGLRTLHHSIGGVDINFNVSDDSVIYEKAWLNHYFTKSWEDWCERIFNKGSIKVGHRTLGQFFEINTDMLHLRDELISSVADRKPNGTYWIDKKRKLFVGGNVRNINQLNNSLKKNILIESNNGRLGNQLYPIMIALSFFENNKDKFGTIYFKNFSNEKKQKISQEILKEFPKIEEKISFINTESEFNKINKRNNLVNYLDLQSSICPCNFDSNLLIQGCCQNAAYISEDLIRKYFRIPEKYKKEIFEKYGDLSSLVSIHIRRGDYLSEQCSKNYYTLTPEYLKKVINKHFVGESFICISDDIDWCKENLGFINNIVFVDNYSNDVDPVLVDLFIPMLCKSNICSPSSFSMTSAMMNPNKHLIINNPYHKNEDFNRSEHLQIIPDWAIREDII